MPSITGLIPSASARASFTCDFEHSLFFLPWLIIYYFSVGTNFYTSNASKYKKKLVSKVCPSFHVFEKNENAIHIRFFDCAHTFFSYRIGNAATQQLTGPVVTPQKWCPCYPSKSRQDFWCFESPDTPDEP